jgi:ATP-binding protein involved in chromosome partitioning
VLILSGKGGVGKSTVAANLALKLAEKLRVGALDLDLFGPNLHILLGLPNSPVTEASNMLVPSKVGKLEFMSVAQFIPEGVGLNVPVQYLLDMVKTMLQFTRWNSDIVVVDFPPGSQDIVNYAMGLVKAVSVAVMVTEPHLMSIADCNRLIDILNLNEVQLRALVLNKFNLFPEAEKFEKAVERLGVPVVKIPWDTDLLKGPCPDKEYFGKIVEAVL